MKNYSWQFKSKWDSLKGILVNTAAILVVGSGVAIVLFFILGLILSTLAIILGIYGSIGLGLFWVCAQIWTSLIGFF